MIGPRTGVRVYLACEIGFHDAGGWPQQAVLTVKFTTMIVRPPIGKQKQYQRHALQIIHAEELNPPAHRAAVLWKLITNLAVETLEDAVHKLGWYASVGILKPSSRH